MSNLYRVYVDGVLKEFTSSSYETEFGYKPTIPRNNEMLFGGRYENRTFFTASSAFPHSENGFNDSNRNIISGSNTYEELSGSYNIGR